MECFYHVQHASGVVRRTQALVGHQGGTRGRRGAAITNATDGG